MHPGLDAGVGAGARKLRCFAGLGNWVSVAAINRSGDGDAPYATVPCHGTGNLATTSLHHVPSHCPSAAGGPRDWAAHPQRAAAVPHQVAGAGVCGEHVGE